MPWGCCTVRDVGPPPKVIFGDGLVLRSSNVDLKVPLVLLTEYFEPVFRRHGPKAAFIDAVTGESTSYQDLWEQAAAMASAFRQRGLTPGAKVCFHCSNHVMMWPTLLGITSINGVIIMAKASLTVRELLYQLDDSRPMFVVTEPELAPKVEECKESVPSIQASFKPAQLAKYKRRTYLTWKGYTALDIIHPSAHVVIPRTALLLILEKHI
ncbi:uncharacterized protein LOC142572575 [Dermacentor variabilis]|uniref:uncharacterized protein LOC142572575 n=1 Tax=Dermacentor variabilis TaxID=34621 RepID=UPI003F5BFFF6